MKRVRFFSGFFVIVALVLVACGGGSTPEVAPAGGGATDESGEGEMEARVPDDVPIYAGSMRLLVDSRGNTITYSVEAPLQDVFDFYKTELEARGWGAEGGSESLFGQLGTILRTKDDQRLTVTLNGNPKGNDVFIQINVAR